MIHCFIPRVTAFITVKHTRVFHYQRPASKLHVPCPLYGIHCGQLHSKLKKNSSFGERTASKLKCDLCHFAEAASLPDSSILCTACAETISRLITIEKWMKHRLEDSMRNKLQELVLLDFASKLNCEAKGKAANANS